MRAGSGDPPSGGGGKREQGPEPGRDPEKVKTESWNIAEFARGRSPAPSFRYVREVGKSRGGEAPEVRMEP